MLSVQLGMWCGVVGQLMHADRNSSLHSNSSTCGVVWWVCVPFARVGGGDCARRFLEDDERASVQCRLCIFLCELLPPFGQSHHHCAARSAASTPPPGFFFSLAISDFPFIFILRPCLVHPKIQKVFKIPRHIKSCGTCMKH